MKKVVFFVILAMVLNGFIAAQNANNDAQRIVGTWTDNLGWVWVFNANGAGVRAGMVISYNFLYAISANGQIRFAGELTGSYQLYMSPDGNIMMIGDWIFVKN